MLTMADFIMYLDHFINYLHTIYFVKFNIKVVIFHRKKVSLNVCFFRCIYST